MIWYVIATMAFAAAMALLVLTRLRDRRYEKLKTSEAMSPALKEEIEKERGEALERREKFQGALKEAEGKK